YAMISRRGGGAVFLPYIAEGRIARAQTFANSTGVICRAVIDDDAFPIRQSLLRYAQERLGNQIGAVIGWNDDADLRHAGSRSPVYSGQHGHCLFRTTELGCLLD